MPSLVEELQRDALNSNVRLSDVLRKAKAIAYKLDLPELEAWVEKELNGYPMVDVPQYRTVSGQVKGRNPYHGWQPVHFGSSETEQSFSKRIVHQKVAELEDVIANVGDGGMLQIPLSAEAKAQLMNATGFDMDFTVMVPSSAAVGILDAVRNALLGWALKLEKSGIVGDGMSFSSEERKRAREEQSVIHIGSIGTFTGTMGSGSGDFTVQGDVINADSKTAILDLIWKIRTSASQLELEPTQAKNLDKSLEELQHEVGSPKPAAGRVRKCLESIRKIAEDAAGSLVAQGILWELSKLIPQ